MPTTNPVPSQDPSDLLFNAGKLDEVVNGTANSFTDRLGATRRTVAGMNADFDAQLADAESDLNVYRADAASSAAEALGYLQTIRATSYGAYASDPATDPLGNPPTVGDEYFNTTANLLKRWNGTTWQASDINTANLAASSGASLVGCLPAGTGAVATNVQSKLRETVSVKDFGAVGDGVTDDTVAIQAALDYAESTKKALYLPIGTYAVSQTLRISEFTTIRGEGRHYSVITGVPFSMTTPIFTNKAPEFIGFLNLSDFAIAGGSYGIYFNVTSEIAYNFISGLLIVQQSVDNFYANKLLQTTDFRDCRFTGANRGVVCAAWTANLNNFYNCEFFNHTYESISFGSNEINNFIGCHFGSAPATVNATTIVVSDSRNLNFYGCYFEGGHARVLYETGSDDSVTFENCHFTGAGSPSTTPFTFVSDGLVNFGSNSWYLPSDGPAKIFLKGQNYGMLGKTNATITHSSPQVNKLSSGFKPFPAGQACDVVVFNRPGSTADMTNISILTGVLTVNFASINAGGFSEVYYSRVYHVRVRALLNLPLAITATLVSSNDSPNGTTLTLQQKAGANDGTATLEAVFTGWGGGSPTGGATMSWAFESDTGAAERTWHIVPKLP